MQTFLRCLLSGEGARWGRRGCLQSDAGVVIVVVVVVVMVMVMIVVVMVVVFLLQEIKGKKSKEGVS